MIRARSASEAVKAEFDDGLVVCRGCLVVIPLELAFGDELPRCVLCALADRAA